MNNITVIKRDNREVSFDPNKIFNAIRSAAVQKEKYNKTKAIGIAYNVTEEVEKVIENNVDEITVEEIQDIIEQELMEEDYYEIAKCFIKYRDRHKKIRNIDNKFEEAINMIDEYVGLHDWKVKENSNMSYSLQGLNNHISSEITKEYWKQEIYSDEINELHDSGDLHIHDLGQLSSYCVGWDLKDLLLEGFSGVSHKVESSPPKHFDTALMQCVNFLFTLQGESAGAQAFSSFDTYLAPFIAYDDLDYEEVKQAMQKFIFNINVPTRVGFQSPFTNITLDLTPPSTLKDEPVVIEGEHKDKTYKDFQDEMDMFNRAFSEVMVEGDRKGRMFSFPIPTYNVTEDFPWEDPEYQHIWEMTAKYGIPYFSNMISSDISPEDVRSMCCRLRISNEELRKRGGGLFGSNPKTGSIGVVTLNMPRIGYKATTKGEFLDRVEYLMDVAKSSLQTKRTFIEKLTNQGLYPYTKFYLKSVNERFGEYWKNHFSTIGLLGLNEALENFMNKPLTEGDAREFGLEVMEFMNDKLKEYQEETGDVFNLEATPAESTTYRFAKLDREKYGDDIICTNQQDVKEGKADPYYSNSSHFPVDYTNDIFEELELQDEFQKNYSGGTVIHAFLGERPSPEAAKKLIKRSFENFELPYLSVTPTFSICPKHGYIAGEHKYCPKCDAELGIEEENCC